MGYVYLDPSGVNEFVADVQAIALDTRAEKGCLFYAVALDDARDGRVLVVERWQDQESLTAHMKAQRTLPFQKWLTRITSDILKYDASNERSLLDLDPKLQRGLRTSKSIAAPADRRTLGGNCRIRLSPQQ